MNTPSHFPFTDTRCLRRPESKVMCGTLRTTDTILRPTTALSFRADLAEGSQKAAMHIHRQQRHQEWMLAQQVEIQAKTQGTLVSVLEEEARRARGKQSDLKDQKSRARRQQALAIAFLIIEAHRATRQRMSGQLCSPRRDAGAKRKLDIANPVIVNCILSDVDLLLGKQDSAKVDVTQYVRGQIAELNEATHSKPSSSPRHKDPWHAEQVGSLRNHG